MATYTWSTLTNGQRIALDPLVDVLVFDAGLNAANIGVSANSQTSASFTVTYGSLTVIVDAAFAQVTTSNFTFSNGSLILVGDNTAGIAADDNANTLNGGTGDDVFFGLGGADTMSGGAGNDVFYAQYLTSLAGNDSIDGGTGSDTLAFIGNSSAAVTVNLATGTTTSTQGNFTLASIEGVVGTSGNDSFTGGDPTHATDAQGVRIIERFRGDVGNDTITGAPGLDFFTLADYSGNGLSSPVVANLATGTASDGLFGTDTLVNVDALRGGLAGDRLTGGSQSRSATGNFAELYFGSFGNDTFDGANATSDGPDASVDRVDYGSNTALQPVNVNLATGIALDGFGGTDTLIDIDQVYATLGNDTLVGSDGREGFDGGVGNDLIDGGGGNDLVHFQRSTAGVIVNLSGASITVNGTTVAAGTANDGMGGTDTLTGIEGAQGSPFDDYFRGSDDPSIVETFQGGPGNDTLNGGAGTDFASYADVAQLLGPVSITLVNGSATVNDRFGTTDTLIGIEGLGGTHLGDTLTGGTGTQWFRGNGGNDTLNGGGGTDWVTYLLDPAGVNVNLGTGTATDGFNGQAGLLALGGTDTLLNLENIEGSAYADTLAGNAGNNVIWGEGGNDGRLRGDGGNDTILGGAGNDWIEGETGNDPFGGIAGNDLLDGGTGADTILGGGGDDIIGGGAEIDILVGEAGNDQVNGGAEFDAIDGRAGADILFGEGGADIIFGDGLYFTFGWAADLISGGDGDDIIMGEAGENSAFGSADVIYGDDGNDLLDGSAGDDTIFGGSGNDVIDGDVGNDVITGGEGSETMLGSNAVAFGGPTAGNDRFVYNAMADAGDNIYGFDLRVGEADTIDLRTLFNTLGYTGTDPRATGHMLVFQQGANADVYIDASGDTDGAQWVRMLTLVDTTAASVTDSYFLFQ